MDNRELDLDLDLRQTGHMTIWQRMTTAATNAATSGPLSAVLHALSIGGRAPDGDAHNKGPQHDVRFTIALIALCAKMARSDGAVTLDEVEAFKRVVEIPPGEAEHVRRLFDLAKKDIAGFESYARQIGKLLDGEPQLRRDVLEGLFVIAAADGILHEKEDVFLTTVARHMHIPATELKFIRSLFVKDAATPYELLDLTPAATNAEIKSRHRELVLDNHPDRLLGRGVPPEFVSIAERKLAAINAAFDTIARERGL